MPRAESGDERRDCVTLWAVQLRRASAVAESTLRVTGMTGHRPTFLPGRCRRPMRGGTRPDAGGPADAASARACAAGRVTRLGLRTRTTVVKSGGGMRMFKFPLSNPAVRPRRISFTDTGSSIRFVGGLAWRRYALSESTRPLAFSVPPRSRSRSAYAVDILPEQFPSSLTPHSPVAAVSREVTMRAASAPRPGFGLDCLRRYSGPQSTDRGTYSSSLSFETSLSSGASGMPSSGPLMKSAMASSVMAPL